MNCTTMKQITELINKFDNTNKLFSKREKNEMKVPPLLHK